jgi:hypothetical protein
MLTPVILPLFAAILADAAAASPDPAALGAAWAEVEPSLRAKGRLSVPSFTEADWAKIAKGEILKRRLPSAGAIDAALGVGFLPYGIDAVWVGILDDVHDDLVEGLSETWLPGTTPHSKRLYQHLDLPAPFDDRHWAIRVQNTQALHAATAGKAWERVWAIDPAGQGALNELPSSFLTAPDAPNPNEALWTPVNEGGWTLVPAQGGVIVVYQVRTDIGGNIPDELVLQYALSTLDELIEHVGELAARAPSHYRLGHYDIVRPDGARVPAW